MARAIGRAYEDCQEAIPINVCQVGMTLFILYSQPKGQSGCVPCTRSHSHDVGPLLSSHLWDGPLKVKPSGKEES